MLEKIKQGIDWRKEYYYQQWLKAKWEFRKLTDFSKKEKVDGISVIVVGRNDNYGGDFKKRLQTTLDWNLEILPNPELIYIEWNPIETNETDCIWISERYAGSKCFIVPKRIHNIIAKYPSKMPVMEYFAKNLGIREASKKWTALINADVYLDPYDFKDLYLSKNHIYGTYFVNVKWDGSEITKENYNKNILKKNYACANLSAVVGNFIMTLTSNLIKSTGYDESLKNTRSGVDNDGLFQLISKGLKCMIIGTHYHMDHSGSSSKGSNASHGDTSVLKGRNYPYINNDDWGLANYKKVKIRNNVWQLEEI